MPSDVFCSHCLRARPETGPLVASPLSAICRDCARAALDLLDSTAGTEAAKLPGRTLPWANLTDEELLSRLPDVADAGVQVEQHLRTWVTAARERKLSWARIGEALGMTRQSAWERFS